MTSCWLQLFIPFPPIFTDFTFISCSFSLTSITWHISSLSLKNIQRDVNKIHFTYLLNHTGGYLLAYYPNSNLFLNLLKISLEFFESISTIMVWDLSFFLNNVNLNSDLATQWEVCHLQDNYLSSLNLSSWYHDFIFPIIMLCLNNF